MVEIGPKLAELLMHVVTAIAIVAALYIVYKINDSQ